MRKQEHSIDLVFILLLFALFTATAVATVLIGIKIYKFSSNQMDANYETRTVSSYILQKVRQNDTGSGITVAEIGDAATLSFTNTYNETPYTTYLYVYDGYMRELTVQGQSAEGFTPDAGQKIMPVKKMEILHLTDHLYRIDYVTEDDQQESLYISTKTGGNADE